MRIQTKIMGLSALALAYVTASPNDAHAQEDARRRAEVLTAVTACRAVIESTARLACYDQAVGALDQAERSGEVQVFDREQIRETRTRLFGLDMDRFNIFARGEPADQIDSVETSLTSARQNGNGVWTFRLSDGSTWLQIDNSRLTTRATPGSEVRIRRGAVGSYLLSVNGSRSLRVRREH